MKKLFYVALIFLTFFIGRSFTSCQTSTFSSFNLKLPSWPPEGCRNWPELDYWKVEVNTCTTADSFTVASTCTQFEILIDGTKPASVTVTPVTENLSFFKPAGCILPYTTEISWQDGFTAHILDQVYSTSNLNTTQDLEKWALRFNWIKFSQSLIKKEAAENGMYNPWLLDSLSVTRKLMNEEFSLSTLTCKKVCQVELGESCISDYVPLNASEPTSGLVKEESLSKFLLNQKERKILTATIDSKKVLSLAINSLPL